jgi:putative transposase
MARAADWSKRQIWQQRLQRFEHCDLTVAAFCQTEGVSVASFQQWRRVLGHRPAVRRYARQTAAKSRQTFLPVEIVGAATIEIHLPNGARLTVPAGDVAALEAAVAAVGRLPAVNGEQTSC